MYNYMKLFRSRLFLSMVCLGAAFIFVGTAVADELPAGLEQKVVKITSKMNLFAGEEIRGLNPEHEEIDKMVGLINVERPARQKDQNLLDHASYRFNGRTIVRGAKGKAVTMNELLTPCQARIYFYPNDRKAPVLYGIDMIGRYKNSRTRWSEERNKE